MDQSIMSFFQEEIEKLEEIQSSVNEENCFSKLVEYFQICREIGKRQSAIIDASYSLRKVVSLFLLNLPYCMLEECDLKVEEMCVDDKFLGCLVNNQKYTQSFMEGTSDYVPMIFTYGDVPSKESITVYDEGINRTLAYIENEEKDSQIIDRIKDLVCNHFFQGQKETLQDFLNDQMAFYSALALTLKTDGGAVS